MTTNIKKRLGTEQAEWPPVIFHCQLEKLLKRGMGPEPFSVNNLAAYLDVTPITVRKILKGGTVSLENALKLAHLVGQPIEEIWALRS